MYGTTSYAPHKSAEHWLYQVLTSFFTNLLVLRTLFRIGSKSYCLAMLCPSSDVFPDGNVVAAFLAFSLTYQ